MSDQSTGSAPPTPQSSSDRRAWLILACWVAGVLLMVTVFFVWPAWMKTFDKTHREFVSCTVRSAEPYGGSTTTRTGIGSPFSYIRVDTKECGTLILQGVEKSDRARVAGDLVRNGRYEFEVGQGSYSSKWALRLFNRYPSAFEYKSTE